MAVAKGAFPETAEKDILRERGLSLIRELSTSKKRPLKYLGLAGRNALDVHKWKEYLSHATVVEREHANTQEASDFEADVVLGLSPILNGNINIVFADIWSYLSSPDYKKRLWAPDIFNLDFCGGFLNETAMVYPHQRTAFDGLFALAQRHSCDFLLFVTLLPRDRGRKTYKQFLSEHVRGLRKTIKFKRPSALNETRKFHERTNLHLFKMCIPLLVEDIGRNHGFRVRICYMRRYTKMIHLALECRFQAGALGIAPDLSFIVRLFNMPLRVLLADGCERVERPPRLEIDTS